MAEKGRVLNIGDCLQRVDGPKGKLEVLGTVDVAG